ncbi:MAG TPA: divergent PAP2 family protein [Candidatus Saccharimonadales bacterium]|nr:divergent PAP2 family protein [Candidatus Saccharimonadales bacterium]
MELSSWLSPYLLAPVFAWLVAQLLKLILAMVHQQTRDYSIFFKSGSMPSSHTATMIALSSVIAIINGVDSALFGIAAVVSAVVIYDALNVRRAVGEQGKILGLLAEKSKITQKFYKANGHVLADVLVGAAVGFVVACTITFIW